MKNKQSINKPKFWKMFGIRFLVCLGIFSIISYIALSLLDDYTYNQRWDRMSDLRSTIEDRVESYCESDPGTMDHYNCLNGIYLNLLGYSTIDYNYAEVTIGDMKIASDKDTAYLLLPVDGENRWENLFIEDISYLDPIEKYMDGKLNYKNYIEKWYKYAYDPVVVAAMEMGIINTDDEDYFYEAETIYVDHEKQTFIPGVVRIENNNGECYEIDCTPSDTKGYELIEMTGIYEDYNYLRLFYRLDPDLTLKNSDRLILELPNCGYVGYTWEDYETEVVPEIEGQEFAWEIMYTHPVDKNVFELAPVTSATILILDIVISLSVSLILAFIKYQRDKTVWNIFLYRTKTTEAMAHDLKTPLAAIGAYAENIEASSDDPAKTREYAKNISEKVAAMDHMISDILALSKSESNKVNIALGSVSVMSLLKESLNAFPDMKTEIKGNDVTLKTDSKLFKQAVDNLLSNCSRYGEEGATADILITPDALTITNKTSMTYNDVDSLKQPFVKGDNTRGNKGTGLGLSIAENNLNILGYRLDLVSEEGTFKAIVKFKP